MRKESTIIAPAGAKYLSEFMTDLPDNCVFDKVLTGCGMTSIVLKNEHPYVIAMPYVNLISNKSHWCSANKINHFAIYKDGDKLEALSKFKGNKILCTYDQLPAVTAAIDPSKWKLVVDEAHLLLTSASYRLEAVVGVLDSFKQYKSYCFGSATHHRDEYQLEELKALDYVKVAWPETEEVNIYRTVVDKNLYRTVASKITKHLKNKDSVHVFINSVGGIGSILTALKYPAASSVRIVCVPTKNNVAKIKSVGERGEAKYSISNVNTPAKSINFYTSTAFEGVDIFDKTGRSMVVVDGNKDFTKVDILTTLPQIRGRVRDSVYSSSIEILYTPTYKEYVEDRYRQEYVDSITKSMTEYQDLVDFINKAGTAAAYSVAELAIKYNRGYIFFDTKQNMYKVNSLMKQAEMAKWHIVHQMYSIMPVSSVSIETSVRTTNQSKDQVWHDAADVEDKPKLSTKPPKSMYKQHELCKMYIENKCDKLAEHHPWVKEAYDILGPDMMAKLKYSKTQFAKAISDLTTPPTKVKLDKSVKKLCLEYIANKTEAFESKYPLIKQAIEVLGQEEMARLRYNQERIELALARRAKAQKPVNKSFKDACLEYLNDPLTDLVEKYHIIPDAYRKLGLDKLKELGYSKTKIKEEMAKLDNEVLVRKQVLKFFNKRLHEFLPFEFIKRSLKRIYTKCGYTRGVNTADLNNYYVLTTAQSKVDGTVYNGFRLISPKP